MHLGSTGKKHHYPKLWCKRENSNSKLTLRCLLKSGIPFLFIYLGDGIFYDAISLPKFVVEQKVSCWHLFEKESKVASYRKESMKNGKILLLKSYITKNVRYSLLTRIFGTQNSLKVALLAHLLKKLPILQKSTNLKNCDLGVEWIMF